MIFTPEAIIFVGIQASGKSEFYKRNFADTHVRINLDMFKTRNRERILLEACIETKQSFVVDNTNPTPDSRARYIRMAEKGGFHIIGYFFQTSVVDAVRRNNSRAGKAKVPNAAIVATETKTIRPLLSEGFHETYFVTITEDEGFHVEKYNEDIHPYNDECFPNLGRNCNEI